MIRKTIAAVTAGLVVLLVTACGVEDSASNKTAYMRAYEVTLPSGKTVTCVRNGTGGVSCDWSNVR